MLKVNSSEVDPTIIDPAIKIPQEAFDWYDEYAHGDIDRRTFLTRLSTLAVAGVSVGMLSASLLPNYALAEQVSFNDSDIVARYTTFVSPKGHKEGRGYLVVPKGLSEKNMSDKGAAGGAPVVLVVHENRGLNPYIKDVARRLAKSGFVAFAPDALHSLGGYPGNDDEGKKMQKSLSREKIEQDFMAAADFLKQHELSNGKLGVVGFCFGGYISNMLAATRPNIIDAAVPYYGTPAEKSLRKNIKAPLMVQLAELDKRVNASWPEYEADLKANKNNYIMHMYSQCNHGFHNDSTSRFDEKNAKLSWERTLAFFTKHLS